MPVIESIKTGLDREPIIKSLVILVLLLSASFYWTDIESENAFFSVLLPLLDVLLLCALGMWFVLHEGGRRMDGSGTGGGFFDGGGDGGGCD